MKIKIPSITKKIKISLVTATSILAVGGLTMAIIGGTPTYRNTKINRNGATITGTFTSDVGIGLFNLDNTTEGLVATENKWTYDIMLKKSSDLTETQKQQALAEAQAGVAEAEANTTPYREYLIDQAKSSVNFVNAWFNLPTMHSLAVAGLVMTPIFLIALVGVCLLKTKESI